MFAQVYVQYKQSNISIRYKRSIQIIKTKWLFHWTYQHKNLVNNRMVHTTLYGISGYKYTTLHIRIPTYHTAYQDTKNIHQNTKHSSGYKIYKYTYIRIKNAQPKMHIQKYTHTKYKMQKVKIATCIQNTKCKIQKYTQLEYKTQNTNIRIQKYTHSYIRIQKYKYTHIHQDIQIQNIGIYIRVQNIHHNKKHTSG